MVGGGWERERITEVHREINTIYTHFGRVDPSMALFWNVSAYCGSSTKSTSHRTVSSTVQLYTTKDNRAKSKSFKKISLSN